MKMLEQKQSLKNSVNLLMRQTKDDGNRSIETYMPRGKWLEQVPPYNKLES